MECSEERIAREDALRYLMEAGGEADLSEVVVELGDRELAERIVEELAAEGLVERRGSRLRLTGRGVGEAERLLERHRLLEKLLSRYFSEPHRLAHSLEHVELDSRLLERLLEAGYRCRLSDLKPGDSGRVLALLEPSPRLEARLYGVGLMPGRRFRVLARLPGVVVVEVGGRMAALDESVAGKVLVVREVEEVHPRRSAERGQE